MSLSVRYMDGVFTGLYRFTVVHKRENEPTVKDLMESAKDWLYRSLLTEEEYFQIVEMIHDGAGRRGEQPVTPDLIVI